MISLYLSRLRSLRIEAGLSQKDVADRLHVSQRTYSDYENGNVRIHTDKIARLAVLYGVSVDYLCGLTDVRTPYPPSS